MGECESASWRQCSMYEIGEEWDGEIEESVLVVKFCFFFKQKTAYEI